MATDIELGVRIANVEKALADLGRVKTANGEVGASATRAGGAASTAAQEAAAKTRELARAATEAGQRAALMQQKIGQLGAGLGQLGSLIGGETGGVIGRMSQFIGAGVSLGGVLGPTGAIVGGIVGATLPALQQLYSSLTDQEGALQRAAVASGEYARSTLEASRAARTLAASRLEASSQEALTRDAQGIQLASEEAVFLARENARARLQDFLERQNAALETAAERGPAFLELYRERITRNAGALRSELDRINAEVERRGQVARGEQNAPTGTTVDEPAAPTPAAPVRRGGGGGRAPVADIYAQEAEAYARATANARELEEITRGLQASEDARASALIEQKDKVLEVRQAEIEAARQAAELEQQHTQERIEAQQALAQTSAEAAEAFRSSWTGGINEVIAAWEAANEALAAAGESQLSTAALLEVGMNSAANSIADTVGGTMVSAFETAVGAWLDGSKTFAEAAEDMVKSVLRSLVIESIVQGVVELARGIASAASMDFAGAALHFGAAAAWAAVGVVAGSVGAGINAFGGGASKGGAATSAEAPRETAQNNQQPAGTTIVNVYPGGFVTRGEVVAGVYDAINEGSRMGMTFDGASVGA